MRTQAEGDSVCGKSMAERHREDGDERPEESNVDLERETP